MLCGQRDGEFCGVDRGTVSFVLDSGTVSCVVWTEGQLVVLCGQRDGELCGVDRGTVSFVMWTEGR